MTTKKPIYENIKQGIIVASYVFALGLMVRMADTLIDIKLILSEHKTLLNSHTSEITTIQSTIKDNTERQRQKDTDQDKEINKLSSAVGIIQDRTNHVKKQNEE